MTKVYELPEGRRITVDFDENGICKVTVQALDSLIGELNYYADKVCDIEDIKADIEAARYGLINDGLDVALRIIDKHCPSCGAKMVEPQESEEISERNIKMWEELFKAESEGK